MNLTTKLSVLFSFILVNQTLGLFNPSAEACTRYPASRDATMSSSISASSILFSTRENFAVFDDQERRIPLSQLTNSSSLFSARTSLENNFVFFTFAQAVAPGNYRTNDDNWFRIVTEENAHKNKYNIVNANANLSLGNSDCFCSYSVFYIDIELDAPAPKDENINYLVVVTSEDGRQLSRFIRNNSRPSSEVFLEIPSMSEIGGMDAQSFCAEVSIVSLDGELSVPANLGCFNPDDYEPKCHDENIYPLGCSTTPRGNIPVIFIFALFLGTWRLYKRQSQS